MEISTSHQITIIITALLIGGCTSFVAYKWGYFCPDLCDSENLNNNQDKNINLNLDQDQNLDQNHNHNHNHNQTQDQKQNEMCQSIDNSRYQIKSLISQHNVSGFSVITIFLVYFICQLFLLLLTLYYPIKSLVTISSFFIIPLSVCLFSHFVMPKTNKIIWGKPLSFRLITKGALSWFIGYPLMIAVSQSINLIINTLSQSDAIQQQPVKILLAAKSDLNLFLILIVSVVFFIPLTEELLFRGYLQNWLKKYLSTYQSIGFCSILFSALHLSSSYGLANYELMASLFTLSFIIGLLYEREKSLWAPIAMHSTFNGISVLILLATQYKNF